MTTPAEICPANAETLAAFDRFVASLAGVCYGPGRGIWENGRFVITYAPGRRSGVADVKVWQNVKGTLYPALHCTSFTNLFLSWLLKRNELFTHGGNGPDLMELLATDSAIHTVPNKWSYRGFKGACTLITPDGSGIARSGFKRWPVVDAKELLDRARAGTLPTFVLFSQSTPRLGLTDHHTGLYHVRDGRLFRIAADGMVVDRKYTAQPMHYIEVTDANVGALMGAVYRIYGVDTADGSYGDPSKPFAEVVLE